MSVEALNEAEQEYELGRLVLPMSVNRFFEEFIGPKASFGFDVFSKEVLLNTEINFEPLKKLKDGKNDVPVFTRKLTAVVPISGVPFCSSSNMEKVMRIERPKP